MTSEVELADSVPFIRDFGFYSVAKFIPSFVSIILLMVFTRLFDPVAYGRYALTMTFVSVSVVILSGWLNYSVVRYASDVDYGIFRDTVLSILAVVIFGWAIFSGIAYYLFSDPLGPFKPFYVAGALLVVVQTSYSTFEAVLRGTLRGRAVVSYTSIHSILKLILALVIGIVILDDILGWLWGGIIAIGVVVIVMLRRFVSGYSPRVDWTLFRRMVWYGVPLIGSTASFLVLSFADRVFIEFLSGTHSVGLYSSNYSIANQGISLAFIPVVQATKPLLMRQWTGDNETEIQRMLTEYTRYFLLIGVPAVGTAVVFAPQLNDLFLGEQYEAGYPVISIVALGLFAWYLAVLGQQSLEVKERTGLILAGNVLAVVVNLVFNFLLIPIYGYIGAAVATVISFFTFSLFIFVVTRREIPWILPWRTVRNCAIAATILIPAYYASWILGIPTILLLVAAPASVAVYGITIYLTGEIRTTELKFIRSRLAPLID